MFKLPGASVPSWKTSRLSSRCRVGGPPFTCLTTDTRMSWSWLLPGRLKCSTTGNSPPWYCGSRSTVFVAGVVYVITCQRCHKLYIGETGRKLSDRFGEHLRSVEGFKQNPRYQRGGFPVVEHFNLPDHNQAHDMRESVGRQVKGGAPTRQREERPLIFKLGTLAPGGLNIDFKFL